MLSVTDDQTNEHTDGMSSSSCVRGYAMCLQWIPYDAARPANSGDHRNKPASGGSLPALSLPGVFTFRHLVWGLMDDLHVTRDWITSIRYYCDCISTEIDDYEILLILITLIMFLSCFSCRCVWALDLVSHTVKIRDFVNEFQCSGGAF